MDSKNLGIYLSSFRNVLRTYNEFLSKALPEYNLSPNEADVLANVAMFSTGVELAQNLGVSKALISRSVKTLKDKGLLEISPSVMDKREQVLTLTELGYEASNKIEEANKDFCDQILSAFSDEEMEVFNALIKILIHSI